MYYNQISSHKNLKCENFYMQKFPKLQYYNLYMYLSSAGIVHHKQA